MGSKEKKNYFQDLVLKEDLNRIDHLTIHSLYYRFYLPPVAASNLIVVRYLKIS